MNLFIGEIDPAYLGHIYQQATDPAFDADKEILPGDIWVRLLDDSLAPEQYPIYMRDRDNVHWLSLYLEGDE